MAGTGRQERQKLQRHQNHQHIQKQLHFSNNIQTDQLSQQHSRTNKQREHTYPCQQRHREPNPAERRHKTRHGSPEIHQEILFQDADKPENSSRFYAGSTTRQRD